MSNITFKIEKDTKWNSKEKRAEIKYYVWAGSDIVGLTSSETEALIIYEAAKNSYVPAGSEIIKEETVNVPVAS